jgi:hypothetical protein
MPVVLLLGRSSGGRTSNMTSKTAQCLALLILKFAGRWVCEENPVRRSAGGVVTISPRAPGELLLCLYPFQIGFDEEG